MQKLLAVGLLVILAGFALVVAGSAGQGSSSVGGVVFIGPFPIAFGSGPGRGFLSQRSGVIGGIMVIILLLLGWRLSRMKDEHA